MGANELAKRASAVERQTTADGGYDTAVPALRLSWFSASSDLVALVYEPSLCIVAQGAKEVLLADETYHLSPQIGTSFTDERRWIVFFSKLCSELT